MPSVLAALCSAFQPLEGRVDPAPFFISRDAGFDAKWNRREWRNKKRIENNYLIMLDSIFIACI
jgi:hypothetical protein